MVVVTGKNGEALSTSEVLKTKQSAWKNVRAQAENFPNYPMSYHVQDDTSKNKFLWLVWPDKKIETHIPKKPAYTTSRNKIKQ